MPSPQEHQATITGAIDDFTSGILSGWVLDSSSPLQPQPFFVEVDGQIVTDAIAHCHRADLIDQGFESGKHGFSIDLELTYDQVSGKLIRLLDKNHQPVSGAEYQVTQGGLVTFEFISLHAHCFC